MSPSRVSVPLMRCQIWINDSTVGADLSTPEVSSFLTYSRTVPLSSTFRTLPEAVFGLTPAIITPFVLERISARRLRYLALSCKSIDASTAQRYGLVDQTATSRVDATVRRLVRVLARVSPVAPRLVGAKGPSAEVVHAAADETLARLLDPDVAARIDAFITSGAAPWQVPA